MTGDVALSTILRQCKLLAARLSSVPLQEWILNESNGYAANAELPNYRIHHARILGHFAGPFGSGLRNANIPEFSMPQWVREQFTIVKFNSSIAEIESLLSSNSNDLQSAIPADVVALFAQNVYHGMNCLAAWRPIPQTWLVDIINSVRNRVLDFAIEIEKLDPNAGEASLDSPPIPVPIVNQVFNTTVIGGAANVVGTANSSTITANAKLRGDVKALRDHLQSAGLTNADLDELEKAIGEDPQPTNPSALGPQVANWIGKMLAKSAAGIWNITAGAATNLLTSAIQSYYGLAT